MSKKSFDEQQFFKDLSNCETDEQVEDVVMKYDVDEDMMASLLKAIGTHGKTEDTDEMMNNIIKAISDYDNSKKDG